MSCKIIKTDVLTIGGSGASILAAINAANKGASVTIVSKGKIGNSGNLIMCGGGFGIDGQSASNLGIDGADKSFTKDKMFDCIVKEGYYISDQNLVKQYVEDSPKVVKQFVDWAKASNQKFLFFKPANWITSGLSMARAIKYGLENSENYDKITSLEDVMIVDLLKNEDTVNGVIAIDINTGEYILINAKSVVIATGGYQMFSFNNTVTDMTGDGIAMALRAGASVSDMEFILSFPTAVFPRHMQGSIYPFIFEFNMRDLEYDIRDKNLNLVDIPKDIIKMSRGSKLSKLVSMYYFGIAKEKGLVAPNGALFYDYSNNSKDVIDKSFNTLYERFDNFHKHGYYKGESLREVEDKIYNEGLLEVGVGSEYCMGGIEIDENMATKVDGLYAAGEVTSGVFGANRVGDGVVEMLCQGAKAGIKSAEFANDNDLKDLDKDQIDYYINKYDSYFDNNGKYDPITQYKSIIEACDDGFSLRRNEEDMTKALNKLSDLYDRQSHLSIENKSKKYNVEWQKAITSENILLSSMASIKAGLLRKESRGCHIRSDYPEVNHDEYLVKFISKLEDHKIKTSSRKPIMTKMMPPEGKAKNVIEYFTDSNLNYER